MKSRRNQLLRNISLRTLSADAPERLSAFYSEQYLSARSRHWGYFVTSGGYFVPLVLLQRLGLRYAIITGSLAPMEASLPVPGQADYDELLELRQWLDFCVPPTANSLAAFVPRGDHVHTMELGSFVADLTQPEDALFAALHSKHRNVVRKAEKDGIQVGDSPQSAEQFYELLIQGARRQEREAVKRSEFDALMRLPAERCQLVVARDVQGNLQGGAVFLHAPRYCHYLYGASIEHPHTGAQNLLHWRHMQTMKMRGVRYYDFMGVRPAPEPGSKYEGIYRFKERFGGQLVRGRTWWAEFRPRRAQLYRGLLALRHRWAR